GDLLKKIVMQVEEEADAGCELIYVQVPLERPADVMDTVRQGKSQLLHGGGARLADMVAGDGDEVEAGRVQRPPLERIDHQLHRRRRWEGVLLLGDELLENIVLDGAA